MIRFPAEWEKQSAVLIAWPHATGDFTNLASVEQSYAFIAQTITAHQQLIIVCRDQAHQRHIEAQLSLSAIGQITFVHTPMNDIWVRDTAFLTVEADGETQLQNFIFNGWGEKYEHALDNAMNHKLLAAGLFKGIKHSDIDFILEGGSVESDGKGTVMTTRQCLLNPNRNKGLSQADIEQKLAEYLGATRVLWVDQANLPGDDTNAHIDTLARFCTETTIAYTSCDDTQNPLYAGLKNMEAQLQAFTTESGKPYELIPLPLPQTIYDDEGRQLPANYSNFLIINDAVMVPVYDDRNDAVALERLAACFPAHNIIATPCRPLVHQYGSLHCMTMQFLAGVMG